MWGIEEMPRALVLAGGTGSRLGPITDRTPKSMVRFLAIYRFIDIVLSNLLYSDIHQVVVQTMYESDPIHDHVRPGWFPHFGTGEERFITYQSPRQRKDYQEWYHGTADAVMQHLQPTRGRLPSSMLILGADHVYLMDYRQMIAYHRQKRADMTVSAAKVRREDATRFGVLEVDERWRLVGFEEKPAEPKPIPSDEEHSLVSMGNYLFQTGVLLEELVQNAAKRYVPREEMTNDPASYPSDTYSSYDFGYDILPAMLRKKVKERRRLFVYDFSTNQVPGMLQPGYWRDIGGSIRDYYDTSMAMLEEPPPIRLNHDDWRVRTYNEYIEPSMGTDGSRMSGNSVIAGGVRLRGATIDHSILSPGLDVEEAEIADSILFGGRTNVGKGARIRRAIILQGVTVSPGASIGYDEELDRRRGLSVADGITIATRDLTIPPDTD
jgi:glucose-1-phosphate adenylyltransferase